MAPRSLEHKVQLTMFRTGVNLAFLSRGILGWFTSRLDCITSFCVVYAFTGIIFTVSHCIQISFGLHYVAYNFNALRQAIRPETSAEFCIL